MQLQNKHKFWLCAAAVSLLALVLYWPALSLPLMFDDLLHIRLASEVDFATVWLPNTRFGFYRPLVFVPLLALEAIFGRFPPLLLHAINVAQHAFNCFLLAWLAWRLWGKWYQALTAGLFIAFFPFAYQAVATYGNNVYPTSGTILLLLSHLFLASIAASRTIDDGQKRDPTSRLTLAMLVLFVAGLLSHETLVLFGPIALLLQVATQHKRKLVIANYRTALLFTLLGIVYIVLYQFLPTGGGPSDEVGTTALLPKLLYLLQTAVFPISWLAGLTAAFSEAFVIVGFVVALVLSGWALRLGQGRGLLLGWGWWLLASAVIGLNLPTFYVLHGARLVYLGGIGAALLWAVLLGVVWDQGGFGRMLSPLVLIFVAATGWLFVRDRLAAFQAVGEPVRVIQQTMAEKSPDDGVLLVNLPAWIAPITTTFPVGVEYATLMGNHLFAEELVAENVGGTHPVLVVEMADLLANPTTYSYGIHQQGQSGLVAADWVAQGSQVFVSRYLDQGIETSYAGAFLPPQSAEVIATFGGYELISAETQNCPSATIADLTWRVQADQSSPTASIFAQLLDENGVLIAQLDGAPLGLNPASYTLPTGWRLAERRLLTPEAGRPTTLLLGSYDYTTGERFPAVDAQGQALQDNALAMPLGDCK